MGHSRILKTEELTYLITTILPIMIKKTSKKTPYINMQEGVKAYIKLRQDVTRQGILDRAYGYYAVLICVTFFGLFLSAYMIVTTPISFFLLVWCVLFALFSVQVGGLIHDAGHRAIAKTTKVNDLLGNIFGAIVVVGYQAWNINHNKHHAHTNQEDQDPDLELPLHGFTKRQYNRQKGLWKIIRKYQVYSFYPLRSLAVFNYRLSNINYLKKEKKRTILWIAFIWFVGIYVWFVLPFIVFSFPKALFIFLFVHIPTGFYLSNVFAPNHKGMPQIPKNVKISFIEHQIMTSRNIYGNWLTDYIFMGLNYQIEHHLFPNCPRNKLKLITPYVLEVCKKMNMEYTQTSIIESNKIILASLQKVALS